MNASRMASWRVSRIARPVSPRLLVQRLALPNQRHLGEPAEGARAIAISRGDASLIGQLIADLISRHRGQVLRKAHDQCFQC